MRRAWLLIAVCAIVACRKPVQRATPASEWATQIAAVRNASSDRIEITHQVINDNDLVALREVPALHTLIIDSESPITDQGLAPIVALQSLDHLRIRGAHIHDDGLRALCRIKTLRILNLPQARLTDRGLESLVELPRLELLRFGSPDVTDAGMTSIAKITWLRWLHLIDIRITDAGLEKLKTLPHLESLYLDGARVSDDGFEKLFRDRPDLHVHVNQVHHDRDPRRD